ncbi:MAG: hypothetical protein ABH849_00600 [Nanoarchaeota archaeon]
MRKNCVMKIYISFEMKKRLEEMAKVKGFLTLSGFIVAQLNNFFLEEKIAKIMILLEKIQEQNDGKNVD